MKFPDKPTCHPPMGDMFVIGNTFEWRDPKPDTSGPGTHLSHHTKTCNWCGSTHPEALLELLKAGATLEVADMKYGYLHKLYITAPNPEAGKVIQVGTRMVAGLNEPIMGKAGDLNGKFYTDHLQDEGYDEEALMAVLTALTAHTPYEWGKNEKGIYYVRKRTPISQEEA